MNKAGQQRVQGALQDQTMKALVYGGGAVGLGLASCLLKSGARVDILARRDTVASLRKDGLVRTGIFGDYRAASSAFTCYASLDELPLQTYEYILVCTKSFDSFDAAKDLSEHKSSTLQDIAARKRTEIDALNGAVIKLAEQFRLAVPYNLVAYNLVKFIEADKSFSRITPI